MGVKSKHNLLKERYPYVQKRALYVYKQGRGSKARYVKRRTPISCCKGHMHYPFCHQHNSGYTLKYGNYICRYFNVFPESAARARFHSNTLSWIDTIGIHIWYTDTKRKKLTKKRDCLNYLMFNLAKWDARNISLCISGYFPSWSIWYLILAGWWWLLRFHCEFS